MCKYVEQLRMREPTIDLGVTCSYLNNLNVAVRNSHALEDKEKLYNFPNGTERIKARPWAEKNAALKEQLG